MGGVHPSFMPSEALEHADAVVVGEVEPVMPKILDDLESGSLKGIYKSEQRHSMDEMSIPRYDLVKKSKYLNSTFIQTSRGCHHGCTFCAEQLLNGLRIRHRPVDEVIREIDMCGECHVSLNDADFFGHAKRAKAIMQQLKGRGIKWQAGVNSRVANNDELLELAAESGCYMLSIGFESISRNTLKSVHKHVNRPETFHALVEKIHSYGILVFGLFMFGFDGDDPSVFEETTRFNIEADYDACAYSVLTPYPGTLLWYDMLNHNRVVCYDWNKYDQGHIVYRPTNMDPQVLRDGHMMAYKRFYSLGSIARRFPYNSSRSRLHWCVYNYFFRKGEVTGRTIKNAIASPTEVPCHMAVPPIMPVNREMRELVLSGNHY